MFLAGDELLHTQGGNNNPYNQDNETTWLNWDLQKKNHDILRFFRLMIAFRRAHPSLCRSRYWREDVRWHGPDSEVDTGYDSRCLAFFLDGAAEGDRDIYVMINAGEDDVRFTIQDGKAKDWHRAIDTSRKSPHDICESGKEVLVRSNKYLVKARSVVVLVKAD